MYNNIIKFSLVTFISKVYEDNKNVLFINRTIAKYYYTYYIGRQLIIFYIHTLPIYQFSRYVQTFWILKFEHGTCKKKNQRNTILKWKNVLLTVNNLSTRENIFNTTVAVPIDFIIILRTCLRFLFSSKWLMN